MISTMAGGGKIKVPMMNRYFNNGVRYGAFNSDGSFFATPTMVSAGADPDPKTVYPGDGGFVMAELPYKGGELSMVVLLPQVAEGLPEVERNLTALKLQAFIDQLRDRAVDLYLPKFKLETDYQMNEILTAKGMARAFVNPALPNGAQFDGMSAGQDAAMKLYIGNVIHKAFVEVNEKGTEAAAATAIMMAPAAAPARPETMVPFTPIFRGRQTVPVFNSRYEERHNLVFRASNES